MKRLSLHRALLTSRLCPRSCKFQPLSSSELAAASPGARRTLALRAGASGPATSTLPTASTSATSSSSCHLQQLTRLHFVAADVVQAAQLSAGGANGDLLRGYDLVSITPKNERVLHMVGRGLCNTRAGVRAVRATPTLFAHVSSFVLARLQQHAPGFRVNCLYTSPLPPPPP